jgi:hypothetical protein
MEPLLTKLVTVEQVLYGGRRGPNPLNARKHLVAVVVCHFSFAMITTLRSVWYYHSASRGRTVLGTAVYWYTVHSSAFQARQPVIIA